MSPPHGSQAHSRGVRYVSLQTNHFGPRELKVSSHWISVLVLGCKVEMFYLGVEAVNTHRDRPLVSQRVDALRHSTPFDTKASNAAAWEREWDFVFCHKAAAAPNISAIHSFNPVMFVASASWMRAHTPLCARLPASQTPSLYPSCFVFFLRLLVSLTLNLAKWLELRANEFSPLSVIHWWTNDAALLGWPHTFLVALVALVFLIKDCSPSAVWHTFIEKAVVWFYLCLKGAICKNVFL